MASTTAKETARYSRFDQIRWRDRDGSLREERVTVESVKAALLAVGTKGYFTIYAARTAVGNHVGWRLGIRYWRNLRLGYYSHG